MEFLGQLKTLHNNYTATHEIGNDQSIFILEKIKETRLKFSHGSVTVL